MADEVAAVVHVGELLGEELRDLDFEILCGADALGRRITHPRVQKPGLAFAGYYDYIKPGRVQIVGESETAYLHTQSAEIRRERFREILDRDSPVFIVTKGLEPVSDLLKMTAKRGLPILRSPALSSTVIKRVSYFLEEHLVPSIHLHGVLLDIYSTSSLGATASSPTIR